MPLEIGLVVIGVLFLLSAFFSAAETALFSLSKIERKRLRSRHPKTSKLIDRMLDAPRRTLVTIVIGNLFVNTLSSAMVTLLAMESDPGRVGWWMLAYTLFLIFFCEILPKVLAVRFNEAMSCFLALPLLVADWVLMPIRVVVRKVSDRILALLGQNVKVQSHELSEDELRTFVEIGEEEGVLDSGERQMIQKLFALGKRPVKDIMTPRIDMVALNVDHEAEKHREIMQRHHFSHLPVFQETRDHILGVVSVQDYMLHDRKDLTALLKQPIFIPETKRIDEVLEEFRSQNKSFAVCVDEHGGTAGIVTLEDVLEEIFGEYYDEYASVEHPIKKFAHEEYLIEAKISLSDFNTYFGSQLKAEEASTLGGFIMEKLGQVPVRGKTLKDQGFEFRIHDMIRLRVKNVMVKRVPND